MSEDEEVTIRTLTTYQDVMTRLIQQYRGRVVDTPGDNLLAEFASVVDAVQCAVATQRVLTAHNAERPSHRTMVFRIGINLGDVVVDGRRIYGEGVNLAARLENLADGGGICISGAVYDQIATKLALPYVNLGERTVKNIVKPVRVYRIKMSPEALTIPALPAQRRQLRITGALLLVLLISMGLFGFWPTMRRSVNAPSTAASDVSTLHPSQSPLTLVVHPFDTRHSDSWPARFSTGITQVLLTDLTRLAGINVITPPAELSPKNPERGQQTGQALKAQYVLQGSVHTTSTHVRITAQLLDAATGQHLWAERYDQERRNAFTLQDTVAREIVMALEVTLPALEQRRLSATRPPEIITY